MLCSVRIVYERVTEPCCRLCRPVRDHNFGDSPDQCQLHAAPSGDKRSCESMRAPTQIADYASMGAYLIANRGVDSSGRWIGGRQLAQGNARTHHSAPLDCNDVVRSHKRQKLAKAEHSGPHTTEGASMRTVAPASIVSSDSDCAGHVSTTSQSETLSALSKLLSAARQCTSTRAPLQALPEALTHTPARHVPAHGQRVTCRCLCRWQRAKLSSGVYSGRRCRRALRQRCGARRSLRLVCTARTADDLAPHPTRRPRGSLRACRLL